MLTFEELPSLEEIRKRAENVGLIAGQHGFECAMIGGAPYLMSALEKVLEREGVGALYAFSKRETKEEVKDGVVEKKVVFTHQGFIRA